MHGQQNIKKKIIVIIIHNFFCSSVRHKPPRKLA